MTPESENILIKAILECKDFGIKVINKFELLNSLLFIQANYQDIISLIKRNKINELRKLSSEDVKGFREFLYIVKFTDQNDRPKIGTIYDSDELYQDPQVIDIFAVGVRIEDIEAWQSPTT